MVLFPPPFYFVYDISNLLSYIQNISSNELAHPVMGTIFLVCMLVKLCDLFFVCAIVIMCSLVAGSSL